MDTANSPSVQQDHDPPKDTLIETFHDHKIPTRHSSLKGKPKKPKRNKSAFILFSIEKRAEFKSDVNDHVNSNQMMVKLADSWKELPKEEKEKYNSKAKNDKLRYLRELDAFSKEHPHESIQNRTKKNHIKKPCSAYALFLKEMKKIIKRQDPDLKMADILKVVSEKWKQLPDPERLIYQERARAEKAVVKARLGKDNILQESTKINILPSLPFPNYGQFYEGAENQPHQVKREAVTINPALSLESFGVNKGLYSSLKDEGPYFDQVFNRINRPIPKPTPSFDPFDEESRLLMNLLNRPMIETNFERYNNTMNLINRSPLARNYPSLLPTSFDTLNTLASLAQRNLPTLTQNDIINNIILNALKPENNQNSFPKLG
jgi:hypothetical protein